MSPVSKTTSTPQGPLHDLSAGTVASLEAIGGELDKAQLDIEALEKIGMDVSRLKERLDWGRNARKIILERFKPK